MRLSPVFLLILTVLILARAHHGRPASGAEDNRPPTASDPAATEPPKARFIEGKDYVVMERVRFLDRMGFDRPVEAFSLLFPKGWKTEGGIKWRGIRRGAGAMGATFSATAPRSIPAPCSWIKPGNR
ncbi:MAG: hypothetical protein ACYDC1_14065 [Limisphaerales bacterium]